MHKTFAHLNQHNYEAVTAMFDPRIVHTFAGSSALSGTRRSRSTAKLWYERLFRLFPDIRFQVQNVVIAGLPWDTRVAVQFRVDLSEPDDKPFYNEVAQFLQIKWGHITNMHLYEDTDKLTALLSRMTAQGIDEAAAAPIVD
ncbi:nuclear transport factor 2 family protein [Candidatus Saccharibacteria bacterium]|nr:nuclear transport factor 2 family protein [Candidatus Saccharibacteria bacterium]